MIIRLVSLLLLIGISIAQKDGDDVILRTSYGAVKGYTTSSSDGVTVKVFKNVPFATPPVGPLRWKLPQEPKKWKGVRDGTKYSAACMSNSTTSSSPQEWVDEDCLYLNVFAHGDCSRLKKCPIVVYYHGGGMNYDSAVYFKDPSLIDTFASKGVVLVIPAFRLGFTGQFSIGDKGDLIPKNLGMHDALNGLKFIHDEAAAFGGDKDEITLMGHSFGGGMAIMLGFSPIRKLQVPLKHLIAMSPGLSFERPEGNENLSKAMIERANCTNVSDRLTLACMMKKDGQELLKIQRKMEEDRISFNGAMFGGVQMAAPLFPTKSIPEFLASPPSTDIMIGTTCAEMDFPPTNFTPLGLGDIVWMQNGMYMGLKNLDELDQLYVNLTRSGKNNQTHVAESQGLYIGAYVAARAVMEKGNKAFVYSFDQPTHHMHTDDLSYLMGIHLFERDENEKVIAQFYPQLFLNFSKYGVPSPEWKPMNLKDRYFSIAVNLTTGRMPETRHYYEKETIDFWVRKAPKIDKMITVTRAAGAKMQWDKTKGGFRDLVLDGEEEEKNAKNETLIPVLLIHTSYFPSFLLISAVFLLGIVLGRYLLTEDTTREERLWILGPDGRGIRVDKVPEYAEQMF